MTLTDPQIAWLQRNKSMSGGGAVVTTPPASPPASPAASQDTTKALPSTDTTIYFDKDLVVLTPSAIQALDAYAKAYLDSNCDRTVTIDGYASVEGTADHNQKLSDNRARSVGAYLTKQKIPGDKLVIAKGHGATGDMSHLQVNRRVDIAPNLSATQSPAPPPKSKLPSPDFVPDIDFSKAVLVEAARVARLDKDVTKQLLAAIGQAETADGDMNRAGKSAGVDINKPDDAVAPLKQRGSRISKADKDKMDGKMRTINAQKDALNSILLQAKGKHNEFVELLDELRHHPAPSPLTTEDYEKAHDDAEHLYDGAIQASKFVLELADGPVGALLELAGTDLLKDGVKGGNIDELVGALKDQVDDMQMRMNALIKLLRRVNVQKAKDIIDELGDINKRLDEAHAHYVDDIKDFDAYVKDIIKNAGPKGGSNPDLARLNGVYQAISTASKDVALATQMLAKTSELHPQLSYWSALMVPLGQLILDGNQSGDLIAADLMVFQNKTQNAFYLPQGGLTNTIEELAAAVARVRQLEKIDGAAIEKLREAWMKALVNAM
jgi:outer membrane protein OmpA-like peptidoglycan-associated protein